MRKRCTAWSRTILLPPAMLPLSSACYVAAELHGFAGVWRFTGGGAPIGSVSTGVKCRKSCRTLLVAILGSVNALVTGLRDRASFLVTRRFATFPTFKALWGAGGAPMSMVLQLFRHLRPRWRAKCRQNGNALSTTVCKYAKPLVRRLAPERYIFQRRRIPDLTTFGVTGVQLGEAEGR